MEFYEEEHDFLGVPAVQRAAADELLELLVAELDDRTNRVLLALLQLHHLLDALLVELLVNDGDVARLGEAGFDLVPDVLAAVVQQQVLQPVLLLLLRQRASGLPFRNQLLDVEVPQQPEGQIHGEL